MSNNLGAPQVADNQSNKETTINDAVGRLDAAITAYLSIAMPAGNLFTLSTDQCKSAFQFAVQPGDSDGACTLALPALVRRGLFVVSNATGQTLAVAVTGQASPPTIATGTMGLFFSDGVAVAKLA